VAIFLPPVLVCDRLMPSAVEIGIGGANWFSSSGIRGTRAISRRSIPAPAQQTSSCQHWWNNRGALKLTLIEQGGHSEAAAAASRFLESSLDATTAAYTAGCFLSRCVPLAEQDKQLFATQRRKLVSSYTSIKRVSRQYF
jgi:hypothetical protein